MQLDMSEMSQISCAGSSYWANVDVCVLLDSGDFKFVAWTRKFTATGEELKKDYSHCSLKPPSNFLYGSQYHCMAFLVNFLLPTQENCIPLTFRKYWYSLDEARVRISMPYSGPAFLPYLENPLSTSQCLNCYRLDYNRRFRFKSALKFLLILEGIQRWYVILIFPHIFHDILTKTMIVIGIKCDIPFCRKPI